MKDYEKIVMAHYDQVANEDGDSALSTMKDQYVRDKETEAIINTIKTYVQELKKEQVSLIDVGCGNGYTLSEIKKISNDFQVEGLEKNDMLREIAEKRMGGSGVRIYKGDITESMVRQSGEKDVVISQRVVINLLDSDDQKKAIHNICELVRVGGILILLECFNDSLKNLNDARAEFGFAPIKPSYHNLYLDACMLPSQGDGFERYAGEGIVSENFLSSHYYVGRVLHDIALQGRQFERNSHFLDFITRCVPDGVGDYSPIKFYVFRRMR